MSYLNVSWLRCNVMFLSTVAVFFAFLCTTSYAADPMGNYNKEEKLFAMNYLYRYGYITGAGAADQHRVTEAEMVDAIKLAQYVNELNMTGTVDSKLMKIMKLPRCALPDFWAESDLKRRRKRYTFFRDIERYNIQKWKNPLVYKRLNLPSESELDEELIDLKLRQAFDMWSAVIPVDFVKASDKQPADVNIQFKAGHYATYQSQQYFFDNRGFTVAAASPHCVGNYMNCPSFNGSIFFDDDERWSLRYEDHKISVHFFWAAVHEIGHVLGLQHTVTHGGAMMVPKPREGRTALHNDDIRGAQMLHGIRRQSNYTPPPKTIGVAGDIDACISPIDASFTDRNGDVYFFQEQYYWKVDIYGSLFGPYVLQSTWPELKNRVQAAYVRPDGMTVFFKGRRYWVYNGTKLVEERRPITEYGLPSSMKQLDAVFVWADDGKTYFFKDDKYWCYNEGMKSIEPGYPKNVSEKWEVPTPVSAAMTRNFQAFFFKGMKVYTADFFLALESRPLIEKYWLGSYFLNCTTEDIIKAIHSDSSKTKPGSILLFVTTTLLLIKLSL